MEGVTPQSYTVMQLEHALDRLVSGEGDQSAPGAERLDNLLADEIARTRRLGFVLIAGVTE